MEIIKREYLRLLNIYKIPTLSLGLKYRRRFVQKILRLGTESNLYWKYYVTLQQIEHTIQIIKFDCNFVMPQDRWVIQVIKQVCKIYGLKAGTIEAIYPYHTETYKTLLLVGYKYDCLIASSVIRYILVTIFSLQKLFRKQYDLKAHKQRRLIREGKKKTKLIHGSIASSEYKNDLVRMTQKSLKSILALKVSHKNRKLRLLKKKNIANYITEQKIDRLWKMRLN